MKRLTGFLALFLFAVLPLSAADLSDLTYTTTGGEVTITDCDEDATGELVIPETIEGNPVTSIGNLAFQLCFRLTGITIPDSVTTIRGSAFVECWSLTSITIGNSVTSIGEGAFLGCTSLTNTTIPDSVTRIEDFAFYRCTSLTSVTIGNGVTYIGASAFYNCANLTSITIPDSVTVIGVGAFIGCTALTMIEVGVGNVNYTEVNGVLFNTEMTLLHTYPAGKPVTNYVIPNSVTSIGQNAFRDCSSLTSITIPDSVTNIYRYAFRECTSLTRITFQGSAPDVSSRPFSDVADGAIAAVTEANLSSFGSDGESWNGLILRTCIQVVADLEAQLADAIAQRDAAITERDARPTAESFVAVEAERDAAIAERDARPTTEELAAVEAERDARYTDDQIRGLSADYTIGLNAAGNVQMKFNLFESTDLSTFAPLTLNPDSVSVVDGSICLEFAPTDDAAFFRFSVE